MPRIRFTPIEGLWAPTPVCGYVALHSGVGVGGSELIKSVIAKFIFHERVRVIRFLTIAFQLFRTIGYVFD